MNNFNEKAFSRRGRQRINTRQSSTDSVQYSKDDVYMHVFSFLSTTALPYILFWPKRLFLRTFNECGRQNQSKSIHKCFTVIVSNHGTESACVLVINHACCMLCPVGPRFGSELYSILFYSIASTYQN